MNAPFQWKLGRSKIQMFFGVREALFPLVLVKRAFYAEISEGWKTRTPPISTGN